MDDDEETYSAQRAEQQLLLAQVATAPAAVKAHYDLANLHLDRAYGQDGPDEGAGTTGQ